MPVAYSKKQQTRHNRKAPKRKERGAITPRAGNEVAERAGGKCELCQRPPEPGTRRDRLEIAHIISRAQGGRGDVPWNLLHLCGPSVNTGTCHNLVDYTAAGREKAKALGRRLQDKYNPADWGVDDEG